MWDSEVTFLSSLPFSLLSSSLPPETPDIQATCMYSQYPAILTSHLLIMYDLFNFRVSFQYLISSTVTGIVF